MKRFGIALVGAIVITSSILVFEWFEDRNPNHPHYLHVTKPVGAAVVQPINVSSHPPKGSVLRPSHMDNDDHGHGKGDVK